jgi:hypothetical protein
VLAQAGEERGLGGVKIRFLQANNVVLGGKIFYQVRQAAFTFEVRRVGSVVGKAIDVECDEGGTKGGGVGGAKETVFGGCRRWRSGEWWSGTHTFWGEGGRSGKEVKDGAGHFL